MANFGPLAAEIVREFGAPQQISTGFASWLAVITSLSGGQPNFAQCLAVSCRLAQYAFSAALAPQRNFATCKLHFTSKSCVLLLHGTPAASISQTLRRGTRNGITELSQTVPPICGWAAIMLGIGPPHILVDVCVMFFIFVCIFFVH